MITRILLSLPWTDGKVPREIASEWCLLVRMWAAITLVLWNIGTFLWVQVKGRYSLQCPADRTFMYYGVVFQTIGYLQV